MAGKHAIISYTDLAAAGSRTCMSIEEDVDVPVNVAELEDAQSAVVRGDDGSTLPILMRTIGEVTCYVLNTHIPSKVCHQVANKILDLVAKDGFQQLTILTALRPDPRHVSASADMMESCFNCKPATDYPSVPDDFQVEDAFLNSLLTLLKVEDIPTRFLVARGYRANKGFPSEDDGSLQAIQNLQSTLSKFTSLKFSRELTLNLNYVIPEGSEREVKSMLYM